MVARLILASGSSIRREMLEKANVPFEVMVARIDEESIKDALVAEKIPPRDIADALAEGKARKVSRTHPDAMVIGCDQVLSFKGRLISKPTSVRDAKDQIKQMCGERHKLFSAVVIYEDGEPVWRQIGEVKLEMRNVSDAYVDAYVDRNWESIRHSVGGYKLEEEGVRLFSRIDGDFFNVLGLPLLPLLAYLGVRGVIET